MLSEFVAALLDPQIPFLRYALAGGLLASIAFGVIGSYVVARRISSIAGAISHCVLGGIGFGVFARHRLGIEWFDPMYGAVAVAVLSAVAIGLVSLHAKEREDTVIGALWAVGMAVGLLFIASTPGYVEPMSYLFGNILLVTRQDVWLVAGLDLVVLAVCGMFHNRLLAVCFDEEYARLRGVAATRYYLLLLILTALAVVLLVRVVGIVMVVALLTLPAAVASRFVTRLWQMMVVAAGLCGFFVTGGLAVSYSLDWPSGPVIIVLAGIVYLCVVAADRLRRILGRASSPSQPAR